MYRIELTINYKVLGAAEMRLIDTVWSFNLLETEYSHFRYLIFHIRSFHLMSNHLLLNCVSIQLSGDSKGGNVAVLSLRLSTKYFVS